MTTRHRLAPALADAIERQRADISASPDHCKAAADELRRFADEIERGVHGLIRVATITHVRTRKAGGVIQSMEPIGTTKIATTLPPVSQTQWEKIRRVLEGRDEVDLTKGK